MNVSMRPSGESAGWLTESGSLVIWTHSDRLGAGAGPRDQTAPPNGQRRQRGCRNRSDLPPVPATLCPLDCCPGVHDILQTSRRVLVQTALQQLTDARRSRAGQSCPIRLALQHRRDRARQVLARKRPPPGEQLVQQATERPDVGPLIDGFAHAPARGSCTGESRRSVRPPSRVRSPFLTANSPGSLLCPRRLSPIRNPAPSRGRRA